MTTLTNRDRTMTEMERLSYNFTKKTLACLLSVMGAFALGVGMIVAIPGNLLTIGGRSLCFWTNSWTYEKPR